MPMNADDLQRLNPPDQPGVYIMRDARNRIIYVGKALSLRKRLASYFRTADKLDSKTQALVEKITAIEFMVTDSEIEALILENTLIKKHKPRYNILLRDDKSYPYVKLTIQEPFPRLLVTRRPFADEARYFGPFVAAGPLKEAVRVISRQFRLCQLKQPIQPGKAMRRNCLYYQMGQCDGACMGKQSAEAYAQHAKAALDFMEGGADPVSPQIQARMEAAAAQQEYELAADYRDQLEIFQRLRQQPVLSSPLREERDVIGMARSGALAAAEIFFIRSGNLEGRRHFVLQGSAAFSDGEILAQILVQYYSQPVVIPKQIFLPIWPSDKDVIQQWLRSKHPEVQLAVPDNEEARRLLKMAENNAWLFLKHEAGENELELSAEDRKILGDLALQLGLKGLPVRIEGYDISNISGQDAVGSRVVFTNGKPDKSNYRHYRIRGISGPNDFAMMQQVLYRRLRRIKDAEEPAPDLLVIDGGAGQLSAVGAVLHDLELSQIPVIGLAKREEEIYFPGQPKPLALPKSSEALLLLTRLRDEAHRFAVAYHRNIRNKRMTISDLDQVEGLGPERRRELLRTFGSVASLLQVSEEDLAQVPGIGLELAKRVQATLRKLNH